MSQLRLTFKTGSSNLHSTGLTVGDSFVHSTGINIGSNIKFGSTGVITATSFVGDGSDLTNLPAGLGTALSATATSPLNKMYYTNAVLGIAATTTVDVPASASAAYTQYADINIATDADLIIADGDDLIPDVLGLADFGTFGGGPSAGRMRVNTITNAAANGAPTVSNGLIISGVTTTSEVFVGNNIKLDPISGIVTATNVSVAQSVTATNYYGSGANLTGIDATALKDPAGNVKVQAQASGAIVTGILTANSLSIADGTTFINKHSVGVGTTTTAGRNAGVSTAIGTVNLIQHH